jgi:hypothetical protein
MATISKNAVLNCKREKQSRGQTSLAVPAGPSPLPDLGGLASDGGAEGVVADVASDPCRQFQPPRNSAGFLGRGISVSKLPF